MDHLPDRTAKVGAHDAFVRHGEDQELKHVPHMRVAAVGHAGPLAKSIDPKGKSQPGHVAITRVWLAMMIGGPAGIWSAEKTMATEGLMTSGWPEAMTRVDPTIHFVVTQGCGLLGGMVKGHPATIPWSVSTAAGIPETITRGLAAMMFSGAPCGQVAVVPV
jgi:hypothetical protein